MTALEAMRSTVLLAEANRELRGPIQVVLTWAMVLEKQLNALEVGDRRALLGIKRAASRLTSVIDQMLAERSHRRFYEPLLGDLRRSQIVAQPCDRGTAPAILCGIRRAGVSGPTLQ